MCFPFYISAQADGPGETTGVESFGNQRREELVSARGWDCGDGIAFATEIAGRGGAP